MKKKTQKPKTVKRAKSPPKKKTSKSRVVKTRNHGTFTEAAFFGWIKNSLRSRSRYWKPIGACKLAARRAYKGANKRQKFEYQCNECKNYFPDKQISVDHIVPVGSLKCFNDLPGVVERLFCEIDGLQCLCTSCHTIKSKLDVAEIRENYGK